MKKYVGILAFIVFIIAIILLVEPLEVGDKTPTPISPLIPTATPTVEVLPTIVTPTATKTVTPTPSATPTPTSTSTVVPTKVYPTPMPTPLGHFFYTIERGDNLWNIAVWVYQDGTKYVWICEANNLMHDCSLIHAGNVLWIPGYFKE